MEKDIASIARRDLEDMFCELGDCYARLRRNDISLQKYVQTEQDYEARLAAYTRKASTLPEFLSLLETLCEQIDYHDESFVGHHLNWVNGRALTMWDITQQRGIELDVVYGVRIYNDDGRKKPLFFIDFPEMAEKLGWNRAEYIEVMDALTEIDRSPNEEIVYPDR